MKRSPAVVFGVRALAGLALAAAATVAHADATRVVALAGGVELQADPNGVWSPASVGAEVPEGGTVRTSGDGRAELAYPDGSLIWLKENTTVTVETQRSLLSRLSLFFGSIKAKVPHLASDRRMEFKTPTAVAAVRGTEFVITQDKTGKYDLNVLFGNVQLRQTGVPDAFYVPQGHGYGIELTGRKGETRLLTRAEEVRGLEDWSPNLSPEDRIRSIQQAEEDRNDFRNYVRQEEMREQEILTIADRVQQNDLAAGRTLQDVFGNLVRVEQIILRPTPTTVQVVDLVQRPNYTYVANDLPFSNTTGAVYANAGIAVTNRLDVAQLDLTFGAALPNLVSGWADFFSNHSPQTFTAMFANETALGNGSGNIFAIGFYGTRTSGTLSPDLYIGSLTVGNGTGGTCSSGLSNSATNCLNELNKFNTETSIFDEFQPGSSLPNFTGGTIEKTGAGGQLSELTETPWVGVSGSVLNDNIWLVQNNVVINNNGSIRSLTDFTNSSTDPLNILSGSAYETIMQVKSDNEGTPSNVNFLPGQASSVDLVIIPDLAVAALEQISTGLSNFKVQSSQ
jgi:hypothetical protein